MPATFFADPSEFRAWLDEHLDDDLRGKGLGGSSMEVEPATLDQLRAWNRTLADARYAAIAWPEEWGGRGAGVMEQVVYSEEMHRAHAPGTLNPLGLSNIAPAIIETWTETHADAVNRVKSLVGDLDRVRRVVKVVGFVASTPDFTGQPGVINGASELLNEVFGDAGVHARSAVGVAALPLDAPVEVEMVVEVDPA